MMIFPWEKSSQKFNTSTFSSKKTNDVLTETEFNRVIDNIKDSKHYSAINNTSGRYACWTSIVSITLFILVMFGYLYVLIALQNVALGLSIFFFGIGFVVCILITCFSCSEETRKKYLKKEKRA